VVDWTRAAFGPVGLGAWFKPLPSDAERAAERAQADLARHRREVLPQLGAGGYAHAVCRIVQAGMQESGHFERRALRLARQLADLHPSDEHGDAIDWSTLVREQARVLAVAPLQALQAVDALLPTPELRERALAVAAAVLMVDPQPEAPQYDVVQRLMVYLGVSPERVFALAQALVQPIEHPALVASAEIAEIAVEPARAAALDPPAARQARPAPRRAGRRVIGTSPERKVRRPA
jgi:hypothetical protein